MNRRITQFTLLLATLVFLGACASLPNIVPQISLPKADYHALPDGRDIEQANNLLAAGQKREAASAYFAAANNYPSPQRERLILQAAELAAILKDSGLAQRYLAPLNYSALNAENQARFRFTQAQLALNDRNYRETLRLLPQRANGLPEGLAGKILSARMVAAKSSGDKLALVQELILQEPSLKNDYEVKLNHDRIWNQLQQTPLPLIDKGRKTIRHAEYKGWLDLVYLAKSSHGGANLRQQLNTWQQRNPRHPGNSRIRQIIQSNTATVTPYLGGVKPAKTNQTPIKPIGHKNSHLIAVILPLSGKLANIGNTLLQGIQSAHQKFAANTQLKIYDSNKGSIADLYQSAVSNGSSFVIGPFAKNRISQLARTPLSTPTLGLNYVSVSTPNLYQFGLLPEDEAIQMAQTVTNKGERRVAILTPDSSWGRRLQSALRNAVIERNGKVVISQNYASKGMISNALTKQLAQQEGEIDAILIAASPSQARRLYPALRQSVQRPVYATSHVFNGLVNRSLDSKLDGLIYTETPWILDMLRQEIAPKSSFPRLHAMGMDAFQIANTFKQMQRVGSSFKGKSGKIHLNSDGSLHRRLRWAQFKNGIPVPY